MKMDRLIISPCCNPEMELEEVLAAYSKLGFTKFEAFTGWAKSYFDYKNDAQIYIDSLNKYNMSVSSMHLPILSDSDEGLETSIAITRFAASLGTKIVIFKAKTKELYKETSKKFLDAISDLDITAVLTNHTGKAITSLEDYKEVIELINDKRMKTLLEVGHFHSVGVSWKDGYELLGDSIELIHIKDQIGKQSVPFGTGEIDLKEFISHMNSVGYNGDYVIEMEVKDHENTTKYLKDAVDYLEDII